MVYFTLMQVPSSRNARLVKMLSKAEPRLANTSGYQTKYVEKGGRPLTKFFSKGPVMYKCQSLRCPVCSKSDCKGPALCQVKSVVYMVVFTICDESHKCDRSARH